MWRDQPRGGARELRGWVSECILTTVATKPNTDPLPHEGAAGAAGAAAGAGAGRAAGARKRRSAEDRRADILTVAADVFARDGMHAASTAEIARLAGISHAYLFRIFPSKEELQIAVALQCAAGMHAEMIGAGERARARGEDPLIAMGQAFQDFLGDRTKLRVSLQAIAAAESIPPLGEALRASWEFMIAELERISGAEPAELRAFVAQGMLLKIIAGLGAEQADWVVRLHGQPLPCDVSEILQPITGGDASVTS